MLRSSNNDACQKPSIIVVNIHQLGGCCLPTIHQRMGTTVNDRMGLSEPCTNDQVIYLNNWRTMINMFTYVYHVRRCNDNLISTMGAMLRTSWYLLPSCRIHHDLVPDLNSVGESVEVRSHLPRTWTVLVRATGPPWWKGISYHRILRNCPCWFIVSLYIYNDSEHADFIIITIYHNACLHMRQEEDQTGILWATRLFDDCARI